MTRRLVPWRTAAPLRSHRGHPHTKGRVPVPCVTLRPRRRAEPRFHRTCVATTFHARLDQRPKSRFPVSKLNDPGEQRDAFRQKRTTRHRRQNTHVIRRFQATPSDDLRQKIDAPPPITHPETKTPEAEDLPSLQIEVPSYPLHAPPHDQTRHHQKQHLTSGGSAATEITPPLGTKTRRTHPK